MENNNILRVIIIFSKNKNIFNNKKDKKPRSAYVAWENNNVSKNSENEEQIDLSFMVSHHYNDDEVSNFE